MISKINNKRSINGGGDRGDRTHNMECELVLGEWVLLFIEMVFSFAGRRVSNL